MTRLYKKLYKTIYCLTLCFLLAFTFLSCDGGGGGNDNNTKPPGPAGINIKGELVKITVQWNPLGDADSYIVYRWGRTFKAGETENYTEHSTVTSTVFEDTMTDADNGILYHYKVRAIVDGKMTGFSPTVKSLRGTRLTGTYNDSQTLNSGVFVVDTDTTIIIDGGLTIESTALLCILDGGAIEFVPGTAQSRAITVKGTLRMLGDTDAPARISARKDISDPAEPDFGNQGLAILFKPDSADYNSATGEGNLIINSIIKNIYSSDFLPIEIDSSSPRFYNSRFIGNHNLSYFTIKGDNAMPVVEKCFFEHMYPSFLNVTFTTTGNSFKFHNNRIRGGYYTLGFYNISQQIFLSGQVRNNDFDSTSTEGVYLYNVTLTTAIPLENNYWHNTPSGNNGKPNVNKYDNAGYPATSIPDPVFTPLLNSPAAGCGPDW